MTALRTLIFLGFFFAWNGTAQAAQDCTLVVDIKTSEIIHESGDCKTRHGAQSTFKLPLALMGFDSGILRDEHTPVWDYKTEYESNREAERAATDPTRWEKESIVWFSQEITRKLGEKKFKNYVELLNYGNKDISGDAGKNNGLTHSWLSSSLQISPVEQVAFVRGLLNRSFKLSAHAYDKTMAIVPQFSAADWTVHGKTGTGFEKNADGTQNRNRQQGWFVGWAKKEDQTIVFAKFMADTQKQKDYAGPRTRDQFLKELPVFITEHNHQQH